MILICKIAETYLVVGTLICALNLTTHGIQATRTKFRSTWNAVLAMVILVVGWPYFVAHALMSR